MTVHRLDPTLDTVTDVFSRDLPPVLRVEPGDTIVVRSLDCSGHLERPPAPGETGPVLLPGRRGHCLAGPIAVAGARPGTTLAVELRSVTPDSWGFTAAGGRHNDLSRRLGVADLSASWLLWDLDADKDVGTNDRGLSVDLAPFLGVVGLPPDEPGEHSTIPPRPEGGGNIDCADLVAGSTLYLPVTVPDALLCVGDGHAAQGHGEVGGTAIECGMTTELVVDVVAAGAVPSIHAVTPTSRITFGFDADLNEAMAVALDAMLGWMQHLYGLDRATALALASPTVDLHVTQVVNTTWGVHASLAHDAIR